MDVRAFLVAAGLLDASRAALMSEAEIGAFVWREAARDAREHGHDESARTCSLEADRLDPPRVPWVAVDREFMHGDPPEAAPVRLSFSIRVF